MVFPFLSCASCQAFCHYENTSQLVCFNLRLFTFCILWHFSENSSSLKLFKLQSQRSLTNHVHSGIFDLNSFQHSKILYLLSLGCFYEDTLRVGLGTKASLNYMVYVLTLGTSLKEILKGIWNTNPFVMWSKSMTIWSFAAAKYKPFAPFQNYE